MDKYANTNQVIMKTYVEVQGVINDKRMAEYNSQLLEMQQQQEKSTETQTPIQADSAS